MDFELLFRCTTLVLALLIVALLIILNIQQRSSVKPMNLPRGPNKLPLLGNLHQLLAFGSPHVTLQKLSNKYGPLMFLQLGSVPTVVISCADVAKEIFQSHDAVFSSRPRLYCTSRFSYEGKDIAFSPYGEVWSQVKRIAVKELLSVKMDRLFQSVRAEEVEVLIDCVVNSRSGYRGGTNLSELANCLANNVICRVTLGCKYDGKSKFYETLRETRSLLGDLNVADFYPWLGWVVNKMNGVDARLEKTFNDLDRFYDQVIKEHCDQTRPRSDGEDFLDVLLRLQKDPDQRACLTNNQVKGILTDVLIGGSDTSSETLVWAMCELINNPSTLRKAQDEVRQIAKGKQRVEEIDLPKLSYLRFVIKETLRLHPPVPLLVPRETTEPCTIRGYEIPAKTRVLINAKAISTDPKAWDTHTNVFMPERFLDCNIDYKGQDFEFIPFGVGRRFCPGMNFAVLLIELTLANLLCRFDWSAPRFNLRGHQRRRRVGINYSFDMEEATGLFAHKKNPLFLVATQTNE